MRFIFSIILIALVFGVFISILSALCNNTLKERVFALVMVVVMLLCLFGTMCFQSYIGIWHKYIGCVTIQIVTHTPYVI